ncbi:phosphotransferase family protein [Novosphingobium sp. 9U]|uniref:phosphotransferase family protein n=1 Tax=Novosphingobium sp. 9U TaxID=2653158 RepID=UPI0012F14576|nr:phosphotransferase family protein [Novosphingobium sp. 9U]VWX50206.1 hypothetical protein NOVOSPHI9U_260231 [Novosphingobium sp. 9U]
MTDRRSANLLETAVVTLRGEILPTIDDPVSRIKLDHVTRLLWDVSARLTRREDSLRTLLRQLSSIVPVDVPGPDAGLDELEAARRDAEAKVGELLPHWVGAGDQCDTEAIAGLVEAEKGFYVSQDPDVADGSTVVYRGGRIEHERIGAPLANAFPELTAESLTGYVRGRFGRENLRVSDVRSIPGGFSKQTVFFALEDDTAGTRDLLVIRKDLPVPLIEKTVVNEFPLLQALYAQGFPVAEPLWLEADASQFGGAFLVSRRVAGSNDASRWGSDPELADAACQKLAQVLATLHAFDPAALGREGAQLSAGEHMVREVDAWIDLFRRKRAEAFPLQELPLLWLKANVPAPLFDRPAKLIHGDVGFHNLMFDDLGTVTALLDWEFSVLGDPTQDLCFVRQFVEPLVGWDRFLALYLEAGGTPPCEEAAFFYDLWTRTRNAVGCVDAQTLFDNHMPTEMRFALAGHIFAPYMFVDQCETLLSHLPAEASA